MGFGFWRKQPTFGLFQPTYQVTQKAISFEWDPAYGKAAQQDQTAVWATPPHRPQGPADPEMLDMSVTGGDALGSDWTTAQTLRILEQSPDIFYRLLLSFWEIALGLPLDLNRDWMLTDGPPNYHETWTTHHELEITWFMRRCTALQKNSLSLLIVTDRNLGNKYGNGY